MPSTTLEQLKEMECPYCGKVMAGDEYRHAEIELEKKIEKGYKKQSLEDTAKHQKQIEELTKLHQAELVTLSDTFYKQNKNLSKQLDESYDSQLKKMHDQYEKISRTENVRYKTLEKKLEKDHKTELREKTKKIGDLEKETTRIRKLAKEEAKSEAKQEILKLKINVGERDLMIKRANDNVESLKQQLQQSQAELKGEIGEIDLYSNLSSAFPQDYFRRQTRGVSEADIVQHIRTVSGKTIDPPIVYGNKQAKTITKSDVEKAKKYRQDLGTNYAIIVSSNLPKEIKNEYFGEKDGILLVHSSIVTEVAKQIRNAIIEIAKQSGSRMDREAKESKLYDYIKSQDFSMKVETLSSIYQKMLQLQDKEEKGHLTMWKSRKYLQSQINSSYVEISSGIDSIVQEKDPMHELSEGLIPEPKIEIKKKKRKAKILN